MNVTDLPELIAKKIQPADSGCWTWTAAKHWTGYGHVGWDGKIMRAHRVVYTLLVGPIPDGMTLDHACHDAATCTAGTECPHRACVNPAHLRVMTQADNAKRRAERTHCRRGHEFSAENTYVWRGVRSCLTCRGRVGAA